MPDKTFSVAMFPLLTGLAWLAVITLVLACLATGVLEYGVCGLAVSALAATLNIRCFCGRLGTELHNAFELGRDAGRAEVRPMVRR